MNRALALPILALMCMSCSQPGSDAGSELGSSESSSGDGDGDGDGDTGDGDTGDGDTGDGDGDTGDGDGEAGPGPHDDPDEPYACWEQLGDTPANAAWGLTTQQLLIATPNGVMRVEGDAITTIGSGSHGAIWASDLDNGWVLRNGLVRIVDGALEPWPDAVSFDVFSLGGTGPSDVWAGGAVPAQTPEKGALAHFDGTSWTTFDLDVAFGEYPPADNSRLAFIASTTNATYFGSPSTSPILSWVGAQGGLAPDPLEALAGLSSLDGVLPFYFSVYCNGDCYSTVYGLGEEQWVADDGMNPSFDDWEAVLVDLASHGDGTLWGLAKSSATDGLHHDRVVHRDAEGQWRRVQHPFARKIVPLPDGAVIFDWDQWENVYRATFDCLFGA